jgi:hypothetical protein
MAMVASGATGAGISPAGAIPADESILSLNSDLVLDVPGGSTEQGVQLVQWEPHFGTNQEFTFYQFADNAYVIISTVSGLALDVAGNSMDDGAPVIQWPWSGTANQIWFDLPFGDSSVLVSASSGKVLDVSGASLDPGAPLIQFTWVGGLNQIWDRVVG